MVNAVSAGAAGAPAPFATPDPVALAARIVRDNTQNGRANLSEIKRDLDAVKAQDPDLAAAVARHVDARLTPVQRGQLAAATYAARAPDGQSLVFSNDAPSVADYRGHAAGSVGRALYDRMDRIWGDGRPGTDDTTRIEAGLRTMQASGLSLATAEATQFASTNPVPPAPPSRAELTADLAQLALDLAGIVDPFGVADGSNAIISVGRAIGSAWGGEFGQAGGHLGNGVLSVAGLLPILGDAAKLGKIGKWAQTVADAVAAVAHNPALRAAFEPSLRAIRDAVGKIPQGALDKLPQGARESLERMKGQLDEFFGISKRPLSDIPLGELSGKTILDNLHTLDVATKSNAAIFYSGRGAREAAEKNAVASGRTTLESTSGGRHLDELKLFENSVPDVDGDAAMRIWGKVSTRYAEEASGSVTAFVSNPRPTSVFLTQELPALLANNKVTEIVVRGGSGAEVTIARGTSIDAALAAIAALK